MIFKTPAKQKMTIRTIAKEHPSGAEVPDVKKPGAELQWGIFAGDGRQLGNLRLSRSEGQDHTQLDLESLKGARALRHLLTIEGLMEAMDLSKKRRVRSFAREHAKFQILPTGDAAYFVDMADMTPQRRQYQSLEILLEPTPVA